MGSQKESFCKIAKHLTEVCPDDTTTYIIALSNEETSTYIADGYPADLLSLIVDCMTSFFQNPEKLKDAARILYLTLMQEAEKKSSADGQDRQSK